MIVNADDFGISEKVNAAVVRGFREGVIHRTTILVNMPLAEEAARLAKENGFFHRVGLHVNLTEGRALSEECRASALCDEHGILKGTFHIPTKNRFFLDKATKSAIFAEIEAQMQKYIAMGFTLMHADSHNYVHTYPSVASPYNKLLKQYGFRSVRISRNIPKGDFSPVFGLYKSLYNGYMQRFFKVNGRRMLTTRFFGSADDYDAFCKDGAPKGALDVEIMTHPVLKDGELWDDTLPIPHAFVSKAWLEAHGAKAEEPQKVKLLVTFIKTHVGGAMTSLVNFLNALDADIYDVEVLFYEDPIGGRHGIKDEITILPVAKQHQAASKKNILSKLLYPPYVWARLRERYAKIIEKNPNKALSIISYEGCRYSKRLDKTYDIAISYESSWCMYYTARFVKAARKIHWQHMDYVESGFDYAFDRKTFRVFDKIVFVSTAAMQKFMTSHAECAEKCVYIPNLLSEDYVKAKAQSESVEAVFSEEEQKCLRLVTVARVIFEYKGHDRGAEVLRRLKDEGLAEKVRWLIIGSGKDDKALDELIETYDLSRYIKRIGKKSNPLPYLGECDVFFFPSRIEGRPMAVTEAQILGLVPLVSRYASAASQIENGIDGVITENSTDALYEGVKQLVLNPSLVETLRANVLARHYGNNEDIRYFDALVGALYAGETAEKEQGMA